MRALKRMLVIALVASLTAASIAIGAPRGESAERARGDARSEQGRRAHERRALAELAEKLGVSTADLRTTLREAREEAGRPPRPERRRGDDPPTEEERAQVRERMDQHCTALTDALAEGLGKTGESVRAATKELAKEHVAKLLERGRITQEQADEMNAHIDEHSCIPPLGPPPGRHRPGGPGGPPPGGPPPMGGPDGS